MAQDGAAQEDAVTGSVGTGGDDRFGGLEVYRYIGVSSTPASETTAIGRMTLRPDLRIDGWPSLAVLGVFLQSMGGVNVVPVTPVVVPTAVIVHLRDDCDGVDDLEGRSQVTRAGRTSAVTSAVITSAADPSRVVAHGIATWAFPGGPAEQRGELRPMHGEPLDRPLPGSIFEWLDPSDAEGGGLAVTDVRPAIAEPIALGGPAAKALHGGPLQLLNEAAARKEAARTGRVALTDLATYFLSAARDVPLVATGTTTARLGGDLDVRVELRGECGAGRLCAFSEAGFRSV